MKKAKRVNDKELKSIFGIEDEKMKDTLQDVVCPNGSFTCGLYIALRQNTRCSSCIKDMLRKNSKDRTEVEHLALVKHYGGVREYLLVSMCEFKDIKI